MSGLIMAIDKKVMQAATKMQARAHSLLWRASRHLPSGTRKPPDHKSFQALDASDSELRKILAENVEFLDEYARLGASVDTPGGFWRDLERVAQVLGLEHRAVEFRRHFHEALTRKANREGNCSTP